MASNNKLTTSKRFLVRLSLVTGSTLAAIIGAQSLASLDLQSTSRAVEAAQTVDTSTAAQVAPTITIIRHDADDTVLSVDEDDSAATVTIAPPVPVQVVPSNASSSTSSQFSSQPRTRSSR
ncbi:hypothetical protein [Aggregatilinea lenta]|uniref:hypothetical protein n=1 Tax=Aggregatilinea lenta TaxID=913108 RepID=UPI000E5C4DF0|nr:hypothetical protein [Aggregatilinea lenta]